MFDLEKHEKIIKKELQDYLGVTPANATLFIDHLRGCLNPKAPSPKAEVTQEIAQKVVDEEFHAHGNEVDQEPNYN